MSSKTVVDPLTRSPTTLSFRLEHPSRRFGLEEVRTRHLVDEEGGVLGRIFRETWGLGAVGGGRRPV